MADADALAWCAGLADGGCRPILCAGPGALARSLPILADEIFRPQHAATLVVFESGVAESHGFADGLALLRLLPEAPLLAPSAGEFDQALAFALAYDGPASIWCQGATRAEPGRSSAKGCPAPGARPGWQFGRAQTSGSGNDVALVAWGETGTAAVRAAELLAQSGLGTAVVQARFLRRSMLNRSRPRPARRPFAWCSTIRGPKAPSRRRCCNCWPRPASRRRRRWCGSTSKLPRLTCRTGKTVWPGRSSSVVAGWLNRSSRSCGPTWPAQPAEAACSAATSGWLQLFGAAAVDVPAAANGRAPTAPTVRSLSPALAPDPAQPDAAELAAEQRQIAQVEFSPAAWEWIRQYEMVGNRNVYLWRWCLHGLRLTTLPCVEPGLCAHLCDTKLLSIVLCVLLDDVADHHGRAPFLDHLLEPPWDASNLPDWLGGRERIHAEITRGLWNEYLQRVAGYPLYEAYERVLRFDLLQFLNSMRYSHLVNSQPTLLNLSEHDVYTSHNMMMVSFATTDLMCSPGFPREQTGALRETVWHAQCMGRIGNLLSTWRREIAGRDFTSGIFARALNEGDVTREQLEWGRAEDIARAIAAGGHDAYFRRKWREHRDQCHRGARRVPALDLRDVLRGHDRFFAMHLGSQGLI